MTNLIGHSIGRYHILEQLGEGGMATVYKAYDTRLERDVAIKIIRMDMFGPAMIESILKRFEREAKSLARLTHPNIVHINDYGEHEGVPYLVMDYLPGGTIKERMRLPMIWQEAVRLLMPVTNALEYAHEHKIIHRDVKPANILLTETGHPMLTDFGIAKILGTEAGQTLTGTGVGIGTPEYMAPEQAMGQEIDARVDIYSLGIVLYELVTGRKPYTADTPMAVVFKHLSDPLPRPSVIMPGLPESVEHVLIKALAKKPEDRYTDMSAFHKALEALLAAPQPGSSPVPSTTEKKAEPKVTIPAPVKQMVISNVATRVELKEEAPKSGPVPVPARPASPGATLERVQPARSRAPWIGLGVAGIALVCALGVLVIFLGWLGRNSAARIFFTSTPTQTATPLATNTPKWTSTPLATNTPKPSRTPAPTATPTSLVRALDGMPMVYVPQGPFTMGSDYYDEDKPVHKVTLGAFWIDQTEVTNAMFQVFVLAKGYKTSAETAGKSYILNLTKKDYEMISGAKWQHPQGPKSTIDGLGKHPVVQVSWNDASAYCKWAGARLPSEAEWEKAARGDTGREYPWGAAAPSGLRANFADASLAVDFADKNKNDGYAFTAPVGGYLAGASPYGALDMAGNAAEWVEDWYAAYPGNTISNTDYGAKYRVVRGGSWASNIYGVRSFYRSGGLPGIGFDVTGFRCARSK